MKPKILVPFDFSENAARALAWAADLQWTTGAGPILMVHAISSRPATDGEITLPAYVPNEEEVAGLQRSMLEAAAQQQAKASAQVLSSGSPVGDIILDAAREAGIELIVMGTHGRSGVKRLFWGSVAEHVLRHADCPVVTIR